MIDCQNERVIYHGQPTHDAGVPIVQHGKPYWPEVDNEVSGQLAIAAALIEVMAQEIKDANNRADMAVNIATMLAGRCDEITEARDMLARRCADQARQIAELVSPPPAPTGDVFAAISVHQKQGVR